MILPSDRVCSENTCFRQSQKPVVQCRVFEMRQARFFEKVIHLFKMRHKPFRNIVFKEIIAEHPGHITNIGDVPLGNIQVALILISRTFETSHAPMSLLNTEQKNIACIFVTLEVFQVLRLPAKQEP